MTELDQILSTSQAAEPFKNAVRNYCGGQRDELIRVDGIAPRVKVRRLLKHILATEPHLTIEKVALTGRSGCSDFVGTVAVHTATHTHVYDFAWDCKWRAEQEGWTDYFGLPDQIRAAQEYDWRCFERWEPVSTAPAASHAL